MEYRYIQIALLVLRACQIFAADANPCSIHESINIDNGELLKNGSVLHDGIVYHKDTYFTYSPEEHSEEHSPDDQEFKQHHLRGCICKLKPCVRKCCPRNQMLLGKSCNNTNGEFQRNVTDVDGVVVENGFEKFGLLFGNPCPGERYAETDFKLLQNGSVHLDYDNATILVKDYCMDNLVRDSYTNISDEEVEKKKIAVLLICHVRDLEMEVKYTLYTTGMIISIPFLAATFIVHVILPELQTIHGKSLMCYVGGLTIAYFFLSIIQQASLHLNDSTCQTLGLLVYYSFMVSFFWLNVMSFDIWWTFSGCKILQSAAVESESVKFRCYSIYAWGVSSIAFLFALIMHYNPSISNPFKPGFGQETCWLKDTSIFPYFYCPILILIILNFGFFSITMLKIYRNNRETSILHQQGSRRHSKVALDQRRFWLYMKLFLIMGVNWGFEILSWAIGGPRWMWFVSDLFNVVQGLLIFLFFVWKPKTKQLLIKKYNYCLKKSSSEVAAEVPLASGSSTTHTTSFTNQDIFCINK